MTSAQSYSSLAALGIAIGVQLACSVADPFLPPPAERPNAVAPPAPLNPAQVGAGFLAPVAGGDFLWAAEPSSGKVALIDANTLGVQVLGAGLEPQQLVAWTDSAGRGRALVLNSGSHDVTSYVVDDGEVTTSSAPTHAGANRWALAPSGQVAVAFSVSESTSDPTVGFQEITLVWPGSEPLRAERVAVGVRPSELLFDGDEERLFAITESGISVLELATLARSFVPIPANANRIVRISRAGRRAVVLRGGASSIEVYDLAAPSSPPRQVTFDAGVTDMQLTQAGVFALALGDAASVALLDPDSENPEVEMVPLGAFALRTLRVSDDGARIVAFGSEVAPSLVAVVDLTDAAVPKVRTVDVQIPVSEVLVARNGAHALLRGAQAPGVESGSFAVLDLTKERFPRIVGTKAPVVSAAIGVDWGIVATTAAAGAHEAYVVHLGEEQVGVHTLAGRVLSAEVLGTDRTAVVALDHPEGRLTVFDLASGGVRSLTGFQLSSQVIHE